MNKTNFMPHRKAKNKRFRDYGFKVGFLPTGRRNSITDIAGVKVGHLTKIAGKRIRTGITIIDPGVPQLFRKKLPAAICVANGFGKLAGSTQVDELGTIEAPIALANTLAVGPVMRGVIDITLEENRSTKPTSVNAVIGETNDGFLNDIAQNVLGTIEVRKAYESRSVKVGEGNVGAGTGTRAFSWKGGIGTASRLIRVQRKIFAIGVLVQTNFGGALNALGVPVGELLGQTDFKKLKAGNGGSCTIVLATDAPMTARQLGRVARRAVFGLVRAGSILSPTSGDYAIAFSTNRRGLEGSGAIGRCLDDGELEAFFIGAAESAEEAIYNALFAAETMRGRDGNCLTVLPIARVVRLIQKYRDRK